MKIIEKGFKLNFINKNGNVISKKWFDEVGDFQNGYAAVIEYSFLVKIKKRIDFYFNYIQNKSHPINDNYSMYVYVFFKYIIYILIFIFIWFILGIILLSEFLPRSLYNCTYFIDKKGNKVNNEKFYEILIIDNSIKVNFLGLNQLEIRKALNLKKSSILVSKKIGLTGFTSKVVYNILNEDKQLILDKWFDSYSDLKKILKH